MFPWTDRPGHQRAGQCKRTVRQQAGYLIPFPLHLSLSGAGGSLQRCRWKCVKTEIFFCHCSQNVQSTGQTGGTQLFAICMKLNQSSTMAPCLLQMLQTDTPTPAVVCGQYNVHSMLLLHVSASHSTCQSAVSEIRHLRRHL